MEKKLFKRENLLITKETFIISKISTLMRHAEPEESIRKGGSDIVYICTYHMS